MNQEKLEKTIEEIDLHDKSEKEIERVIAGLSQEAMAIRKSRKKVRYQLYRLQNESLGKCSNVSVPGFKKKASTGRLMCSTRLPLYLMMLLTC